MNWNLLHFTATIVTFFGVTGWAHDGGGAALKAGCQKALAGLEAVTGQAESKYSLKGTARKAVEFVSSSEGRHGGKIFRIRQAKRDDGLAGTWLSSYAENFYDPQGDPRWFVDAIGPKAARFFGFQKIGDSEYLIPDATEFKAALDKINSYLKSNGETPFRFGFFVAKTNNDILVSSYLEHIRKNLEMPMASSGHHLLHDLAFHSGMIFTPNDFANVIQADADLHGAFFDYLNKKYATQPKILEAISSLRYVSNFADTVIVDSITGGIGAVVSTLRPQTHDVAFYTIFEGLDAYSKFEIPLDDKVLAANGLSKEDFLTRSLANSPRNNFLKLLVALQNPYPLTHLDLRMPRMNIAKFEAALASSNAYPTTDLLRDFDSFFKGYRSPFGLDLETPTEILMTKGRSPEEWYDWVCAEIRNSKMRMIQAIETLAQQQ